MTQSTFRRDFWQLLAPYWRAPGAGRAWLLLAVIIGMTVAVVYLEVQFNAWQNDFYNALQAIDKEKIIAAMWRFCGLAACFVVLGVYQLWFNQLLQIRWRTWLTRHLLDDWLGDHAFYTLQLFHDQTDNPDQRLADDIHMFVDITLALFLGLFSAVLTLGSFVVILWSLSGSWQFQVGGVSLVIPGFMVWAALLYAGVGTWLTHRIGKPLAELEFQQQRVEADFRFSLVRLRENAESVALYQGAPREGEALNQRFDQVVGNFFAIMLRQKKLSWFNNGYNQLAVLFPFVVGLPRFLAREIQLGGLMQISSAFGKVHQSLSFIADSYTRLAGWKAVVDRLSTFRRAIEAARAQAVDSPLLRRQVPAGVEVQGLNLNLPDGRTLLQGLDVQLIPGDRLLVTGPSGCGKSTLLRALAGIWPYGDGTLALPERSRVLFLPQRPYLPIASLAEVVCYPQAAAEPVVLRALLEQVGLAHLVDQLGVSLHWAQRLSPGEQQRLGFARALFNTPAVLFLDESSSALDEASESELYGVIDQQLPQTVVVSVGHRSSLRPWHRRELMLDGNGGWQEDACRASA